MRTSSNLPTYASSTDVRKITLEVPGESAESEMMLAYRARASLQSPLASLQKAVGGGDVRIKQKGQLM